jgi:hypothetical protein
VEKWKEEEEFELYIFFCKAHHENKILACGAKE